MCLNVTIDLMHTSIQLY